MEGVVDVARHGPYALGVLFDVLEKAPRGGGPLVLFLVGRMAARRQLRAQRIADATQRRQGVQRPSQSFIAIGADVEDEFVQEVL